MGPYAYIHACMHACMHVYARARVCVCCVCMCMYACKDHGVEDVGLGAGVEMPIQNPSQRSQNTRSSCCLPRPRDTVGEGAEQTVLGQHLGRTGAHRCDMFWRSFFLSRDDDEEDECEDDNQHVSPPSFS